MYLLICKRQNSKGEDIFFPIMKADEDGDPQEIMATWETMGDVKEFCRTHILAKSSENIIIDEEVGEVEFN